MSLQRPLKKYLYYQIAVIQCTVLFVNSVALKIYNLSFKRSKYKIYKMADRNDWSVKIRFRKTLGEVY